MRLRWLASGLASLRSSLHRIHDENPALATELAHRIERAMRRLEEFPHSGRIGTISGTRELVVPRLPFIVIYRVTEGEIQILHVLHERREPV